MHHSSTQTFLTQQQVTQRIRESVIGQPIVIDVGYGGVLFIEIGKLLEPNIKTRSGKCYREISIFSEEYWEIFHNGKKVTSRFADDTIEIYLTEINEKNITGFRIQHSAKKTLIDVGEYTIIIQSIEQFTTWIFEHRIQGIAIKLTGQKQFLLQDFVFERPDQSMHKHSLPKPTPFDQFYKENLPISHANVKKVLSSVLNAVVQEVREYSAIEFCLPLISKENWLLCVHSTWQLKKQGKLIASSHSHPFVFSQIFQKYLVGKKLIAMKMNKAVSKTVFSFEEEVELIVKKDKKHTQWTIFNQSKNVHIDALQAGTFEHIILCPEQLREKYLEPQYGRTCAHSLYALDFYRELLAKK